jgi:hypothetical protein
MHEPLPKRDKGFTDLLVGSPDRDAAFITRSVIGIRAELSA